MYEVVRDNEPQKIIIVNDSDIDGMTEKIQEYIVQYMRSHEFKVKKKDIRCLKNKQNGKIEIIITKFYVNNYQERELFVKGLKEYIEDQEPETGDDIIEKMDKHVRRYGMKGSKSYDLPFQKTLLNGNDYPNTRFSELSKVLIGRVENCTGLKIDSMRGHVTININIINGDQTIINDHSTTNIIVGEDIFKMVLQNIIEERPDWYNSRDYLNKHKVYKWFKPYFRDNIGERCFWMNMKAKVVHREKRIQKNGARERVVRLKKLW